MPQIDAVLFDLAGTLFSLKDIRDPFGVVLYELAVDAGLKPDPKNLATAYRQGLGEAFLEIVSRPFYLHRDLFGQALVGFLKYFGAPPNQEIIDKALEGQRQVTVGETTLRPGCKETLLKLKDMGIKVGVVSNIDDDYFDEILSRFEIDSLIDVSLSSETAKSCKPDRQIFDIACSMASVIPQNAIFVGDTPSADVYGAKNAGMKAVLIVEEGSRRPRPTNDDQIPDWEISTIPDVLDLLGGR
ncbi:MAG: HAD family hydrolase [Acidimicrobiales bacterium]|nr:HAD family hydrolase [Acidimicrobiales bacterium]